jgi:hypothetical protein
MFIIKNPRPNVRYILPGDGDPNYVPARVSADGNITYHPYMTGADAPPSPVAAVDLLAPVEADPPVLPTPDFLPSDAAPITLDDHLFSPTTEIADPESAAPQSTTPNGIIAGITDDAPIDYADTATHADSAFNAFPFTEGLCPDADFGMEHLGFTDFGSHLRHARQQAGIVTLRQFSDSLADRGLHRSAASLGNWERCRHRPPNRAQLLPVLALIVDRGGTHSLTEINDMLWLLDWRNLNQDEIDQHFFSLPFLTPAPYTADSYPQHEGSAAEPVTTDPAPTLSLDTAQPPDAPPTLFAANGTADAPGLYSALRTKH